MASIEEVGTAVSDVFGDQASQLAGHVEAAAIITGTMQARFAAATEGSSQEQTATLHEDLAWIGERLGEIATRLGASRGTCQSLLAQWGLPPMNPTPLDSYLTETQTVPPLSPEHRRAVEADIESLHDKSNLGLRAINDVRAYGYRSVRDLLAAGKDHLLKIRNFGTEKMAWIERRIGRQIPDQPDPVLAARLYSSLREIPLHAVGAREIDVLTQVDGKQRLTVYDILTRPREDLFRPAQRLAGTDGERMALSELEEEYYQKLYTKIAAYAERFNTAKLRQRPSED